MGNVTISDKLLERLSAISENRNMSVEACIAAGLALVEQDTAKPDRNEAYDQLQLAISAARLGIWTLDLATGQLDWNDELLNIYGITREQFENELDSWRNSVHPDDKAFAESRLSEAFEGKQVFDVLFRVIRPSGEIRHVSGAATPIYNDAGEMIKVLGNNLDITDIKRAESQILDQETILNQVSDAVIVTDSNFVIQSWNKRAESLYGWQARQVIGKIITDVISTRYLDTTDDVVLNQFSQHGHWEGEVVQTTKDGDEVYVLASVTLIQKDSKEFSTVVAINRDITARKQAEKLDAEHQRLVLLLSKEKEMTEFRSKMVSVITHEFRTPLAIIMSSSELLSRYEDRLLPEKKVQALAKIADQVAQLDGMIEELKTVVRAETGFLDPNFEEIDVKAFCREIIDELAVTVRSNQEFVLEILTEINTVELDAKLMRIAISNLLSNAIKYSPYGGRICLKLVNNNDGMLFKVSDEGIGIPTADQANLFEPFHRAANVGTIRGTGLGLSIVKEVVDHHHGHVEFDSQLGEGTTFTIWIPFQQS